MTKEITALKLAETGWKNATVVDGELVFESEDDRKQLDEMATALIQNIITERFQLLESEDDSMSEIEAMIDFDETHADPAGMADEETPAPKSGFSFDNIFEMDEEMGEPEAIMSDEAEEILVDDDLDADKDIIEPGDEEPMDVSLDGETDMIDPEMSDLDMIEPGDDLDLGDETEILDGDDDTFDASELEAILKDI